MKIPARLQPLVEEGLVDEVIRPLMSGKEAAVFLVKSHGEVLVAKVYKDVKHRSFRQRAGYTEGRKVRNSRQQRAMEKGSKYGKEQAEEAWQNAEVDALYRLSAAGVRVPRPHMFTDGVLLMDLVADEHGEPAPRLWDVDLTEAEATKVHEFLVRQALVMLCAGMVHGDLSEYNVLIAAEGPIIIDLPQATDAAQNPNAKKLFLRDVHGLTRFLSRFAPALAETHYGEEIWDLYERARLTPESVLTGKWKGSTKKVDTRAVLEEIEHAAFEARQKRERDGEPSGKRRHDTHHAKPAHPKAPTSTLHGKGPKQASSLHGKGVPKKSEPAPPPAPTPPKAPRTPALGARPPAPKAPAKPARPAAIDLDALDALLSED